MSVRDKIRNRIKELKKLADEAHKANDEQKMLEAIIRANECKVILDRL